MVTRIIDALSDLISKITTFAKYSRNILVTPKEVDIIKNIIQVNSIIEKREASIKLDNVFDATDLTEEDIWTYTSWLGKDGENMLKYSESNDDTTKSTRYTSYDIFKLMQSLQTSKRCFDRKMRAHMDLLKKVSKSRGTDDEYENEYQNAYQKYVALQIRKYGILLKLYNSVVMPTIVAVIRNGSKAWKAKENKESRNKAEVSSYDKTKADADNVGANRTVDDPDDLIYDVFEEED